MNKEEKLRDNSKLLKIVIIILFIAFFVLGISQCVNDAVKTTYANNEITENVEVNNKFIDKKVNKAISGDNIVISDNNTYVNYISFLIGNIDYSYYFSQIDYTYVSAFDLYVYPIFYNSNVSSNQVGIVYIGTDSVSINSRSSYSVGYLTPNFLNNFVLFNYTLQDGNFVPNFEIISSESMYNNYYNLNINSYGNTTLSLFGTSVNVGIQNNLLVDIISMNGYFGYVESGGGITPNERFENPLFTIPSGYEKITEINCDINPSQTSYNVARVVVCGKLDFDTQNNDYYYDLFYCFACGGVKKEYEVDKAIRLTNGINDLFLNDRFLIQINISEQNSITFNLSYLQENTTKLNINEEMQCNSSYASNNLFNSKGFNSMLLTRDFIKNYYNDIGFENGRVYGYEQGLNDGNVEGYNQGYSEGESAGYNQGYSEGETAGYNQGFEIGLDNGYNNGFNDGQKDTLANNGFRNIVNSIFNAPYNIFNGFLNFEIFGINLFNLLSFGFTTILIIFIIRVLIKR